MRRIGKRIFYAVAEWLWNLIRLFCNQKYLTDDIIRRAEFHICLLPPLGLGDIVMLSPFIREVESRFPDNKIILITEYPAFIHFDRAVWLRSVEVDRSVVRIVLAPMLTLANMRELIGADFYLGYFLSDRLISNFTGRLHALNPAQGHYLERTFPIMDEFGITVRGEFEYPHMLSDRPSMPLPDDYICIAPFVNWKARQYPYNYYGEIIKWVVDELGVAVVIIGGNTSQEVCMNAQLSKADIVFDLTGKLSIKQSISVIKGARLYVGNDSGPSHFAFIEAGRSVVIFGSVLPENRVPLNEALKQRIVTVDNRQICTDCPCYNGLEEPDCDKDFICLQSIQPNVVIAAIKQALNS